MITADGFSNDTPLSWEMVADMQADYVIITGRLAGEETGGTERELLPELSRICTTMLAQESNEMVTVVLTSRYDLGDITVDLQRVQTFTSAEIKKVIRARCECGNPVSLCHPDA